VRIKLKDIHSQIAIDRVYRPDIALIVIFFNFNYVRISIDIMKDLNSRSIFSVLTEVVH
jgi:hypothetical protein